MIYLYDGWQVIEEREPDGQSWEARRQFVYGGTYIDEPLIFGIGSAGKTVLSWPGEDKPERAARK